MDSVDMEVEITNQLSADVLPFARSYQVDALEKAIKQNTIVFLETGSGKTLIAIMLLRSYAYLIRKPSPFFAVFLVPQVVLVTQQAKALETNTDLVVGMYWGEKGIDYWDASTWKEEVDKHEVLVMTPVILLNALRHGFLALNKIKVLIFDECHHAQGKHPYACIMKEFYHKELKSGSGDIPRIFGMTASLIKTKGTKSDSYWKNIQKLETLMNSKVHTCVSESVLTQYIPFSKPKFKFYQHMEIPHSIYASLETELEKLKAKHGLKLATLDLDSSSVESIEEKMTNICSSLIYCLDELGIWLAQKAAQCFSCDKNDFLWGLPNIFSETFIKSFCLDASKAISTYIPPGPEWSVADDMNGNVLTGLLTTKTVCLIESLLEYSALRDIRCIIFVERVVTAIVVQSLLAEILPRFNNWKSKYVAGNKFGLQSQTRRIQNQIVDEFRKGLVNIIVATSILEEGLDVQSCNLVVRFDPATTVCSFIQSRGRARMQNSDYLLMVKNGDTPTLSRIKNYLSSGDIMREESLCHASLPCPHLQYDPCSEDFYRVISTGATVTLTSSISLIYFYCSRLPSDGYFKPAPRFNVDKDSGICTMYLPKSSPIKTVIVQGNVNMLRQAACLEACKKLHKVGALTDNLVPDMVEEAALAQKLGKLNFNSEQPCYFPPELVSRCSTESKTRYHVYIIGLKPNYQNKLNTHDILLGTRVELEDDIGNTSFDLEVDSGKMNVTLKYVGVLDLTQKKVLLCRRFQITLLRVLLDHSLDKLTEALNGLEFRNGPKPDFLLLPSNPSSQTPHINWEVIKSVDFTHHRAERNAEYCARNASRMVHTKNGLVHSCAAQNALVYTPHTGLIYIVSNIDDNLNATSLLRLRDGSTLTYREYYETRHRIQLDFIDEPLLIGRHIFTMHNYFDRSRKRKEKEPGNELVELPPEVCHIILSPISMETVYSFNFIPSIMHRLECLLVAHNLKKMHLDYGMQKVVPTIKVLEAITTKKCQDQFHLESLETLGDSFLKYAVSQHLFKMYQNHHEGLLSIKKDRTISNAMLCDLGCQRKLQGFLRNDYFEPKVWMVPGQNPETYSLTEDRLSDSRSMYIVKRRNVKRRSVADAVEALIGAYLSEAGEAAALIFMDWIGIKVDFMNRPYEREFRPCAERLLNIGYFESLLNYKFKDRSLLVEAMTHGSYMLPEVPRCYQRLEFLGDSVLDYLITLHLYNTYPGLSPGLLTDMRSSSVNNDCYAHAAVKAKLHRHILHASQELNKRISKTVDEFEQSSFHQTLGWQSEASFPKVLGDVIESLAGAILVDSGYVKETVFACIQPLLGNMVTPETVQLHPVRELTELCQKEHFEIKKPKKEYNNGMASFKVEVNANGIMFEHTAKAQNKQMAKKLACREVLKLLKDRDYGRQSIEQ